MVRTDKRRNAREALCIARRIRRRSRIQMQRYSPAHICIR